MRSYHIELTRLLEYDDYTSLFGVDRATGSDVSVHIGRTASGSFDEVWQISGHRAVESTPIDGSILRIIVTEVMKEGRASNYSSK